MDGFNAQRYWWVVVILAAAVGIAAYQLLDAYQGIGELILFGLIGASFCWVYTVNRERLWWALIPGLGAFTVAVAVLVGTYIDTNTENNWLAILVVGVGTFIIGMVLKHQAAKVVLYIVAGFILITGILYNPTSWAIKGILIAAVILAAVYLMWRNREVLRQAG